MLACVLVKEDFGGTVSEYRDGNSKGVQHCLLSSSKFCLSARRKLCAHRLGSVGTWVKAHARSLLLKAQPWPLGTQGESTKRQATGMHWSSRAGWWRPNYAVYEPAGLTKWAPTTVDHVLVLNDYWAKRSVMAACRDLIMDKKYLLGHWSIHAVLASRNLVCVSGFVFSLLEDSSWQK